MEADMKLLLKLMQQLTLAELRELLQYATQLAAQRIAHV
jgi:hypothetical protein